eukprot:jgi/Ulvmu1/7897/UM004_0129.1
MAATTALSIEQPSAVSQAEADSGQPVADTAQGSTEHGSLYVGDLDQDIQETHLFELFSEYGPVHSIRVCRDTVTRRSLGYAYVNFNVAVDPEAAKTAKAKLNYHVLNGKAIRIMWANKNSGTSKDKSGNIFIKNLEKTITTRELHDTFADFGEILSCKVASDKDGNSKGYGFVHFSEPSAAKSAIEAVNGAQLGESENVVTVSEFVSKQNREDSKQLFTNVYVKNLPPSVETEDDVKALFHNFGEVSSVALIKASPNAENSKLFAFVNFEKHKDAEAACKALHQKEVEGCKLYVDRAQTKAERHGILQSRYEKKRSQMAQQMEGKNVYVKNLSPTIDEDKLREAFRSFGAISSAKVMCDPETKESRGFGFVCFTDINSAQEAVSQMTNSRLDGKQLYVAFAQPKAVRAQQLQAAVEMNAGGKPGGAGKGPAVKPMPGMPGMNFGYNGVGYPMIPFAGRGMVPGMYPHSHQSARTGNGVPSSHMVNGMNPMVNPMMQMMHMGGPSMMPGMSGRGGRVGRGPGRGGAPGRCAPRPGGRGFGGRGLGGQVPHQGERQLQGGLDDDASESLAARLANMPDDARKQQLGEMLFPRLKAMLLARYKSYDVAEKLASKITGMMLEMPAATVLYLLETEDECRVKVDEALAVLRDHGALPDGVSPS